MRSSGISSGISIATCRNLSWFEPRVSMRFVFCVLGAFRPYVSDVSKHSVSRFSGLASQGRNTITKFLMMGALASSSLSQCGWTDFRCVFSCWLCRSRTFFRQPAANNIVVTSPLQGITVSVVNADGSRRCYLESGRIKLNSSFATGVP
eukprot:4241714-Amphidinium_carterae.1